MAKLLDNSQLLEADPLENHEVTATLYPSATTTEKIETLQRGEKRMSVSNMSVSNKVKGIGKNVSPSQKPLVEWTLGDYIVSVLAIGGISIGLGVLVNAVLVRLFPTNVHAFAVSDVVVGAILIGAGAYAFLHLHGTMKMVGVGVGVAGLFLLANGLIVFFTAPKGGNTPANAKNNNASGKGGQATKPQTTAHMSVGLTAPQSG